METREYVEYLLKNYNEIVKDVEQMKFELKTFKDVESDEVIESLNFSSPNDEKISTSSISDKTCKIALIYDEVVKRINNETKEEIIKMIKATEFEITRLNYCIDRLQTKIKEVIKGVYINKKSLKYIGNELFISENTVNRYRKKGIEEIIAMYNISRLAI
ncbi:MULTISPECIES: hypothetical protein [Clostridium]|uniref:Transcriptional regulator n=1 Tax=Clostridium lapidicellarium TaxID=3240931 RepID=A0ABV4DW81_9CLOT